MSDPTGKSWGDLYRAALLEADPAKLPQRVEEALQIVQSKLREMKGKYPDASDRQALEDALQNLRVLQREYL